MTARLRGLLREVPADVRRPLWLMTLAVFVVGVTYGVVADAAGLATWQVLLLALTVLAGSAELLFVGLVGTGANPWLAAAAGIALNLRNFVYGMAAAPWLPRGWKRAYGAHLVNDESVAFAAAPPAAAAPPRTTQQRRAIFWVAGLSIAIGWPGGALAGVVAGMIVPDPAAWGLDAVLPALLGALAVPAIRSRRTLSIAALAAGIAVLTTPWVPPGLAPILGLAAIVLAFLPRARRTR